MKILYFFIVKIKLVILFGVSLFALSSCVDTNPPLSPLDPTSASGYLLNQIIGNTVFSCRSSGNCTVTLSASNYSPDLKSQGKAATGIAGADVLCNSEAKNKGFSGSFKAMLAATGLRESPAASPRDWVFAPNTNYYVQNSQSGSRALLGTTDASGLLPFPLKASFDSQGGGTDQVFTGLATDWSNSGNDCNGWTVADGSANFTAGWSADTANTALNFGTGTCNGTSTARLVCVEQ